MSRPDKRSTWIVGALVAVAAALVVVGVVNACREMGTPGGAVKGTS